MSSSETKSSGINLPDAPDGELSQGWLRAGWGLLFGWWLVAYVSTLNSHGWIWTELATLRAGRLSFSGMLADRATFGHCPVYFSLSWTIQRVFGENEVALRLPSVLFGLGCALLVIRLVRRWGGSGPALLAGLLTVLSPLLLDVSQQARPYALALLFGLAATDVMVDPRSPSGGGRAIRFSVLSLLGLLTSHAYWFVLAAHALVFVLRPRRHARMLGGVAIAVAGAVPWSLYAKFWAEADGKTEQFLTWMKPVALDTVLALPGRLTGFDAYSRGVSSVLPGIITALTMAVVVVGLFRVPAGPHPGDAADSRRTMAALWLVPILGALIAGFLGWGNLLVAPRYFALSAMIQLILIAMALWSCPARYRPWLAAAVMLALVIQSFFWFVEIRQDELRRAAGIVNKECRSEEKVIAFGHNRDTKIFKHYVESPTLCKGIREQPRGAVAPETTAVRIPAAGKGAWVLVPAGHEDLWTWGRGLEFEVDRYLDAMSERYKKSETHELGENRLVHFHGIADGPPKKRRPGSETPREDPNSPVGEAAQSPKGD